MNSDSIKQVPFLVSELYSIVKKLEVLFNGRHFTLDGHLVGSIGEVLAAHDYGFTLLQASTQDHDAIAMDGRRVQIKATQGNRISLSGEPEFLIVLKIFPDGHHEEIYNGPGKNAWSRCGKRQKNGQCPISIKALKEISSILLEAERIPRIVTTTPEKS